MPSYYGFLPENVTVPLRHGDHSQVMGKDYFENKNYCSVLSSRDNHLLLALEMAPLPD